MEILELFISKSIIKENTTMVDIHKKSSAIELSFQFPFDCTTIIQIPIWVPSGEGGLENSLGNLKVFSLGMQSGDFMTLQNVLSVLQFYLEQHIFTEENMDEEQFGLNELGPDGSPSES